MGSIQLMMQMPFENMARLRANQIAVFDKGTSYSYDELNQFSTKIAVFLIKKFGDFCEKELDYLPPNTFIPIFLNNSYFAVASILAILKAGGVFVPIDVKTPRFQIESILSDINPAMILTASEHSRQLDFLYDKTSKILIDKFDQTKIFSKLSFIHEPDRLAYMIYTSGSTGQPKGVMISHRGVSKNIEAQIENLKITENSRVTQLASLGFDVSIAEIFCALNAGAKLYICEDKTKKIISSLVSYIQQNQITVLTVTPALLHLLPKNGSLSCVKTLRVGGDVMQLDDFSYWNSYVDQFINSYGPTETTITAMQNVFTPGDNFKTIGYPLNGTEVYLLDENQNLIDEPEKIGEIYIGGLGVGEGYYKDWFSTEQQFINLPILSNSKLFRTRDFASKQFNGKYQFIKRDTGFIKCNGLRIDPTLIETKIKELHYVNDCLVTTSFGKNGSEVLTAYLMLKKLDIIEKNDIPKEIRCYLSGKIIYYMIPTLYVALKEFPISQNGKYQRNLLPIPNAKNIIVTNYFSEPKNDLEKEILSIFNELLPENHFGMDDDFFNIGGTSVLFASLICKLEKKYNIYVEFKPDFFCGKFTARHVCNMVRNSNENAKVQTEYVYT